MAAREHDMYDLHAYATARLFELDHAILDAVNGSEARHSSRTRAQGKFIRLILREAPPARAA
ncbi:MAG TPA: hypothetical protein PKD27_10095 [Tepidiformaceae bacterium]|nr:hypothetical protein [Tepidiformaceae bacterium]